MILRPRQQVFKDNCSRALKTRGNTLGVAPTGAGKTVMLSAIAGSIPGRILVLQHRDELVVQNERTYRKVNPKRRTSFYTADVKQFGDNETATFSMIQTLSRAESINKIPPLDALVIDEAHHAASDSYIRVIERVRDTNPKVKILGVTATPHRGDSRNLRHVFDNVGDQISLGELIRDGHLVRPRCFVIETGTRDEMKGVRKLAADFDMQQVEAIMNKRPINDKVVSEWRARAGNRQTVLFASTVEHARCALDAFLVDGVSGRLVHGDMPDWERKQILDDFDRGKFQLLANVMVLTEGWDCPPVSCVILLRPCSFKSTMIQMIGRGLRTVDPERYPGIEKDDCIVLDFGYSLLTHKDLEQALDMEVERAAQECPGCGASLPSGVRDCAVCGYEFPRSEDEGKEDAGGNDAPEQLDDLHEFVMTEVDLLAKSPFKWESFFNDRVVMACGFDAWAAVVHFGGRWHAVCGAKEVGMRLVASSGDRLLAMASADDFMRDNGDAEAARKSKQWLRAPTTDKQREFLKLSPMAAMGLSRYRACCAIQWTIMERSIRNKLMRLNNQHGAIAA